MRHRTALFLLFLGLAGICYSLSYALGRFPIGVSTALYLANFTIYSVLILSWLQSVRRRLLPTLARRCISACALMMLFFLLCRTVNYRIEAFKLLFWYLYYVPILFIPGLFLTASVCFIFPKIRHLHILLLLSLPFLLSMGILTNSWHYLAFSPIPGILFSSATGTYAYGPLYFCVYGYVGISFLAGLIFLFLAAHRMRSVERLLPSLLLLILLPAFLFLSRYPPLNAWFLSRQMSIPYRFQEILIFFFLGILECCIRTRLMPCNEGYDRFFAAMPFPALITNRHLRTVFSSALPLPHNREHLSRALTEPVSPTEDTQLYGRPVSGGYVFFAEDVSAMHALNRAMEEANALLSEENELTRATLEVQAEHLKTAERNRLYTKAAAQLYPTQRKITRLLKTIRPEKDNFAPVIARVMVLNAYVKRRSNFVLQEAPGARITAADLRLALEESARFLIYCRLDAYVDTSATQALPYNFAMAVYDTFECLIEALLDTPGYLLIAYSDTALRLVLDHVIVTPLPVTPLPVRAASDTDGTTLMVDLPGKEALA